MNQMSTWFKFVFLLHKQQQISIVNIQTVYEQRFRVS